MHHYIIDDIGLPFYLFLCDINAKATVWAKIEHDCWYCNSNISFVFEGRGKSKQNVYVMLL